MIFFEVVLPLVDASSETSCLSLFFFLINIFAVFFKVCISLSKYSCFYEDFRDFIFFILFLF